MISLAWISSISVLVALAVGGLVWSLSGLANNLRAILANRRATKTEASANETGAARK